MRLQDSGARVDVGYQRGGSALWDLLYKQCVRHTGGRGRPALIDIRYYLAGLASRP